MKFIRLFHPTGHPYWNAEQYRIQFMDGSFFPVSCDHDYKIKLRDDGIYLQICSSSTGTGRREIGKAVKIIDRGEYDYIEWVGAPLVMSEELVRYIKKETEWKENHER